MTDRLDALGEILMRDVLRPADSVAPFSLFTSRHVLSLVVFTWLFVFGLQKPETKVDMGSDVVGN